MWLVDEISFVISTPRNSKHSIIFNGAPLMPIGTRTPPHFLKLIISPFDMLILPKLVEWWMVWKELTIGSKLTTGSRSIGKVGEGVANGI